MAENYLAKAYRQFVTNGLGEQADQEVLRRVKVINITGSILVLTAFIWLFIDYFLLRRLAPALVEVVGIVLGMAFLYWQRRIRDIELTSNIGVGIVTIIFLLLHFFSGVGSGTTLWLYLLPPLAFFIVGAKRGLIWSLAIFTWVVALSFFGWTGIYGSEVNQEFVLNVVTSYLIVIFLAFSFERTRSYAATNLASKNEEMERFVYTVSHDLRTPLASLRAYIPFVKEDIEEGNFEQLNKDLDRIDRIAKEMADMVDSLLSLSRIGRWEPEKEKINLKQIVYKVITDNELQIQTGNIEIDLQGEFPTLFVCERRVEEIFENLISNAIRYMGEQEKPLIEIGVQEKLHEYHFFVRDNGIGIDPKYHDKIFEPFYRLEKVGKGAGIGLTIVKGFVKDAGGKVWVESQVSKGSTFWFSLPKQE